MEGENKPAVGRRGLPTAVVLSALTAVFIIAAAVVIWQAISDISKAPSTKPAKTPASSGAVTAGAFELAPFASEEEFKSWMVEADKVSGDGAIGYGYGLMGRGMMKAMAPTVAMDIGLGAAESIGLGYGAGESAAVEPGRYSETNVQIAGIDEPDIVKTDGKEIWFSPQEYWYWEDMPVRIMDDSTEAMPAPAKSRGIVGVKAFPVADLKQDSRLDLNGDLLLSGKTLIVFTYQGLKGYDMSDPTEPKEKWSYDYADDNWKVDARLKDGKIYLVTSSGIDRGRPCPITPLKGTVGEVSVACPLVWYPVNPIPADAMFTVVAIDAESGKSDLAASFVGSSDSTTVYMSPEAIYVAGSVPGDFVAYMAGFFSENSDLVPAATLERVRKLMTYDLSDAAKMAELQYTMGAWLSRLGSDEQLAASNQMANRMDDYYKKHRRELQSTSIVKVAVDDLKVRATGAVPGNLLNQWSMDEHQGNLRLATTTGGRRAWWTWQLGITDNESVNDVYVLDSDLKQIGSVKDMGLGERIYAVRFIGDRGFVVTFKETDPFYVLDLSVPSSPALRGELKIPGYSSYLHPLDDNRILGVGKEGDKVKLSLFDVADPADPKEISKYSLNEYWSEAANNHRAFMADYKHRLFFIPGGQGGYIIGYDGWELGLLKAVSGSSVKRALYIDDYLYVISESGIRVYDETKFEEASRLDFK